MSNKRKRIAAQRRKEALKSTTPTPKAEAKPAKEPTCEKKKIKPQSVAAGLLCAAMIYGTGMEIFWAKQPTEVRVTNGFHEVQGNLVKLNRLAMDILTTASSNAVSDVQASVYAGTRTAATRFGKPLLVVLTLGDAAKDVCEADVEETAFDERTETFVTLTKKIETTNQSKLRDAISRLLDRELEEKKNLTYQITETSDGLIVLVSSTTDEIMSTFSYIISENPDKSTAEQFELLQDTLSLEKFDTTEGGE